jgi:uncharacterized protein (TIGR03437 family)
MRRLAFKLAALAWCASTVYSQVITTFAGTDWIFTGDGKPAKDAPLGVQQNGVAVDRQGNVFVADQLNHMVMRISRDGILTVVAGNGVAGFSGDGGPAVNAALNSPTDVAVDRDGNLFIADRANLRVRKVTPDGTISTAVGSGRATPLGDGGPAKSAGLSSVISLTVDGVNNLYLGDAGTQRVRKVTSDGVITTVAGNGQAGYTGDGVPAIASAIYNPWGLAVDAAGNLYIADRFNHRIRKVTVDGIISTFAGNGQSVFSGDGGPAASASLRFPTDVAVDAAGNVFITDTANGRVRKVTPNGIIATVATSPTFPDGIALDDVGNLYVTDRGGTLRTIGLNGLSTPLAGNGGFHAFAEGSPASNAFLASPNGLSVDSAGNLYISDSGNYRIRRVSPAGNVFTLAGNGLPACAADGSPAVRTSLGAPASVAVDPSGATYYSDSTCGTVVKLKADGTVSIVAGKDGSLSSPLGIAFDTAGNLYIADSGNQRILKIAPSGTVSTLAGNGQRGSSGDGGLATLASLNDPSGVAADTHGNVYIADRHNNRVRIVTPDGNIGAYAGSGRSGFSGDAGPAVSASLAAPYGIFLDAAGNLYIADEGNQRVRVVSPAGIINTIAGSGQPGFSGDGGPAVSATMQFPKQAVADARGNVYIADFGNNRIRKILASAPTFSVSTAQITLSAVSQGASTQTSIVVSSSVAGLAYSVTLATNAGGAWLDAGAPTGLAPGVVTITADPGKLPPGTYQGTVTLRSPGAIPDTLVIAILLQVAAPQPASLSLQTQSLSFSFTANSGPSSQQLTVSNQGAGSISFTASATGGAWLSVSPQSGAASGGAPAYLTVTATPGSLGAGTYSGSITIASTDTGESIVVPVTMSISATPQKILLSQTGLTFIAVAQAGAPLPQSFGILNAGQGSMSWTASTSTLSGGPNWLSVDQTSGTVPRPFLDVSPVNVSINPAGLPPGTYYGQIQVKAAGAANSPQSVSVVLNLLPAGSNPGPEIRPTGVIFIGAPGNSPGSQSVMVSNATAGPLSYGSSPTYVTGGGWLQYLPANATVAPGQPVKLVLQSDLSNLQPGIQRAAVTLLFADGSARTVSVLNVVAPGAGGATATAEAAGACTTLLVHPTTLTDTAASVMAGQPVALSARVADNCGNLVTAGAVVATFTNGDPKVDLVHVGDGNWSGTWTPRGASQNRVTIQFTAFSGQGLQLLSGAVSVAVTVQPGALTPQTFGAANAASGVGTYISPGGLVSIFGQQLADSPAAGGDAPFPTQVNGTQVLMGGKPLPLRYVDNGQVNAQVPFDLVINTQQQMVVQRGSTLSVPQDVIVAAAQPAIYTQDQRGILGSLAGVIVSGATNALITPANPAHAGDVVEIYCNGLGAVIPPLPSGFPAPVNGPLSQTANPLTVTIGGINAVVNFAGLAPGYPDLYQVNVVVPSGVAAGASVPVILSIAGQTSPAGTMAVR